MTMTSTSTKGNWVVGKAHVRSYSFVEWDVWDVSDK